MPAQSGDFSASQLSKSIVIADKMFKDDMRKADYIANVDVYNAVKSEQNADVKLIEDKDKDRDVTIHWINACGEAVSDGDDFCDIGGEELSSDKKDYSLGFVKSWGFNVDEEEFRTNDYNMEEIVSKGFLRGDKLLSEAICQSLVGRIESFKGVNQVDGGLGTVNAGTGNTDIAAADWNENLFAYLYRIAIQNELANPFLLSGNNLFDESFIAMKNQANGEGKGSAALYNSMRKYFDLFNMDTILTPEQKTFMINRGALAFAHKSKHTRKMRKFKDRDHWSMASRNLTGVDFDVKYTNACEDDTIMHKFTMVARYDLFSNPSGCNQGRTGVLAFNKV